MKETKTKAKEKKVVKEQENVEEVSQIEQFFRNYAKTLIISVTVIVVVAVAVFLWNRFAYQPKVVEAQEQMYPAENNFRYGDYELALNGDGNVLGFEQIIKDYGKKGGKAVYFYAGVCELQLGNYSNALDYLKKYKGKDHILLGRAQGCIGDCYIGLEDYSKALTYFEKAAKTSNDIYSANYLLKAGVTSEELGDPARALNYYKEIRKKYPDSIEGLEIDKYISRIEAKTK